MLPEVEKYIKENKPENVTVLHTGRPPLMEVYDQMPEIENYMLISEHSDIDPELIMLKDQFISKEGIAQEMEELEITRDIIIKLYNTYCIPEAPALKMAGKSPAHLGICEAERQKG